MLGWRVSSGELRKPGQKADKGPWPSSVMLRVGYEPSFMVRPTQPAHGTLMSYESTWLLWAPTDGFRRRTRHRNGAG